MLSHIMRIDAVVPIATTDAGEVPDIKDLETCDTINISIFYNSHIHKDSEIHDIVELNIENILQDDMSSVPDSILIVDQENAEKVSKFIENILL